MGQADSFLANDAGSNVTKKTTDKCNYYNMKSPQCLTLELSMAIDGETKKNRVAVVDGFSKKMRTLMDWNRRTSRVKRNSHMKSRGWCRKQGCLFA